MTTLPPSPFLSASDGLHPLSSVAVTLGATLQLENVTAEIPKLARQVQSSLPSGESDPAVMSDFMSGDPAVATSSDQPRNATAGTNTAWVRDCDRIEMQEIQSSDGVVEGHQRFITPKIGFATLEGCDGPSDQHSGRPGAVTETARINPRSSEASAVIVPCQGAVAADRIDDISEIFTFARGLMRDYQPDFQELLNEIAPFPMEYLPDYRLGDDDQPLFLQGAVA